MNPSSDLQLVLDALEKESKTHTEKAKTARLQVRKNVASAHFERVRSDWLKPVETSVSKFGVPLCFDFTQSGTPDCLKKGDIHFKSTRGFGKPLYKGEAETPCLFCKFCFEKRRLQTCIPELN